MKHLLISIILIGIVCSTKAQSLPPYFVPSDSIFIESLLSEAHSQKQSGSVSLHFARKFINIPYVASTLEISPDNERLVLNLKALDCTTLVEIVSALTICCEHGERMFSDFLKRLTQLRYRQGIIKGYTSRNHYYSSWIENAEQQKLVHEISFDDYPHITPFLQTQTLHINYMSTHPESYISLKKHPEMISEIQNVEKQLTGKVIYYIPKKALRGTKQLKRIIKDGDILALVTSKAGLDVSHLGFAVWGKDGELHLLNASSLRHKVIEEPRTLQAYMNSQKSQLGIRVIRIKESTSAELGK